MILQNHIKFAESRTNAKIRRISHNSHENSRIYELDCHDFATQNLAMTEKKRRIYKFRRI
ncbi:hypothetical protein [Helicobacter sp. 23-1045]